jgi:hypothetical protein
MIPLSSSVFMTRTAIQAYERHVPALTARDLDTVVAGHSPDAVLVASTQSVNGSTRNSSSGDRERSDLALVMTSHLIALPNSLVGLQNSATAPGLGFYAARSYSLMIGRRGRHGAGRTRGQVRDRVIWAGGGGGRERAIGTRRQGWRHACILQAIAA